MRHHPFDHHPDGHDDDRGRRWHPGAGPTPFDDPGFRGRHDHGRRGGPGPHGGRGGRGGPPPWLAGLFGFGRPDERRGPRVRRGDVRHAILDVLRAGAGTDEDGQGASPGEPPNGYQVITAIAERTDGAWKPSPGSVYPTVNQLEDEGLVTTDESAGRRSLRLTEAGRAYCAAHADELAAVWVPFDADGGTDSDGDLRAADIRAEIGQVMGAVWQIASTGSENQRRAAVDVLVDTRRRLYGILAEGPEGAAGAEGAENSAD